MFYNLLVSGNDTAWEDDSYIFDTSRCIKEYTSKEIVEKFISLGKDEINELRTIPCIFAYETHINKDPIFGYITDVIVRREGIKIYFEKIKMGKFLLQQDLDSHRFELDIDEWELNRTHWAIKEVDLEKQLRVFGIELGHFMRYSNKTINIATHCFDVSFTFAGEYRAYVKATVCELEKTIDKNHIFYDDNYKAQLARPSLDTLLQDIYRNRSNLIVAFLCEKYQEKEWPGLEFRAIKDIIKEKNYEKIMLIKLDDGQVDGIFSTDGYIDGSKHTPKEVAGFIVQRINALYEL